MDQIRIGKFIAQERKRKQMTQQQLADILGISNKTVSKWECGNGFPEISLVLPLCEELEISVNELLSAERLPDEDYKKKAEENMVDFIREKEENKKKMHLALAVGLIATISYVTLAFVVFIYGDVMAAPVRIILTLIAIAVFAVGIFVAMKIESTAGYFRCRHCSETFVPEFYDYVMSLQVITKRRLVCPGCGKKSWCKRVMSKEEE